MSRLVLRNRLVNTWHGERPRARPLERHARVHYLTREMIGGVADAHSRRRLHRRGVFFCMALTSSNATRPVWARARRACCARQT